MRFFKMFQQISGKQCTVVQFFKCIDDQNIIQIHGNACSLNQIVRLPKVIMQVTLFQRCMHLLYCSVLSLGGNVNTRRMSKPDIVSIFHIKNQLNILVIGNYYVNYQNYLNVVLLTSSDT